MIQIFHAKFNHLLLPHLIRNDWAAATTTAAAAEAAMEQDVAL